MESKCQVFVYSGEGASDLSVSSSPLGNIRDENVYKIYVIFVAPSRLAQ